MSLLRIQSVVKVFGRRLSGNAQPLRFKDKVAVVTGGCQGIGRGCVDVLAEHGGKVIALDITDDIGSKIESNGPGEITYIHCDVTKEDEVKKTIEEVAARFTKIDCLVNNVGGHPGANAIDDISIDDFRKTIEHNLVSNFTVSKYALPHIRKCKGSIVNITSLVTTTGLKNSPTYCATKAGVTLLTKALAIDEAKHGVRVNAVSPSNVWTPLFDVVVPEEVKKYLNSCHQLGRHSQPREIGLACLFLAVDATFTTGEELKCSGGSEIGYGVKDPDALF